MSLPKHWQWRAEWLVQASLEAVLCRLPGGLVHRLGALAGGVAWHLLPRRRNVVLRNLRIALADTHPPDAIPRIARRSFQLTGANLFSAAHSARLSDRRLREVMHVENPELLENAAANGKGVVLLLAHMGNWELLSRIVRFFPTGTRGGAFYRPLNNPLLDKRTLDRRQADGVRMFSKHDGPHQAAAFLREGGIVGILSDQRVGMLGEVVPFFGRLTRSSPLPSLLARRTKSNVLALALNTTGPGRWSARYVPVEGPPTTAACMDALERAMRPRPDDIFWFQDRWRVYLGPEHPFRKWLGETDGLSNKPHRALLWLTDAPDGWQPTDDWLHPDLRYEAVLAPGRTPPAWLPRDTAIHQAPGSSDRDALRLVLTNIDHAQTLPLDFVLAPYPPQALAKACRREGIPMIAPNLC